jgi:hypothetical protein
MPQDPPRLWRSVHLLEYSKAALTKSISRLEIRGLKYMPTCMYYIVACQISVVQSLHNVNPNPNPNYSFTRGF